MIFKYSKCKNSQCIDYEYKCDYERNCFDRDDENCDQFSNRIYQYFLIWIIFQLSKFSF